MDNVQDGLITFSDSDVKAGYLVQEPNWYDLKILSYRRNDAKSGKSVNYFVIFRGESGEMNGVEWTQLFNTSDGFRNKIVRLFVAANGGKELASGQSYNWDNVVGITISGYVQRGQDQNSNSINDVVDYRPKQ